jgi:hypothetical protein
MLQSTAALSRHGAATGCGGATRRAISTSVIRWKEERKDGSSRSISTSVKMEATAKPTITLDNMNPAIKKMEYAVRGPLVIRATEIEKEIEKVGNSFSYVQLLTVSKYQLT